MTELGGRRLGRFGGAGRAKLVRLGRWALAWGILVVATLMLNRWRWTGGPSVPAIDTWVLKLAGNTLDLLCLPGWFAARAALDRLGFPRGLMALAAVGMSWMGWLLGAWMLLRVRARLARGGRESTSSEVDLTAGVQQTPMSPSIGRRRFLANVGVGVPISVGALVAGQSLFNTPWRLRVAAYEMPIMGLPPSLHGLRLVQISDTHLGPFVPSGHIRGAVRRALELKPDVVLLTGDYIFDGAKWIERAAELFRPLTQGPAAVPTIGTLGNHDWWGDGPAMRRALMAVGVQMIDNDRVFIDARTRMLREDCPADGGLCLAGLGDLMEDEIDPGRAFAGVPDGMPRVVLAHNPDTAEDGAINAEDGPRVDVMISGHTHGGQVRLPIVGTPMVPSAYGQKYAGGLVQGPRCPVVVSRGVGMSVLPIRFCVPPEVVLITLVARDG